MTTGNRERNGGRILVDQLLRHGVERVFCVPGESYLPVLDALYDERRRLPVVSCRHDGGAAFMAEAAGKLDGRPGVCLVTRGPGATNAAIAVHVAEQDSTPMLLVVGQVARAHAGCEAFQEVDYERLFGGLARHVEQVETVAALPEAIARAFATACGDRAGPVVLAVPEDVLRDRARVADAEPRSRVIRTPAAADVVAVCARLSAAARPLLLVGGSSWTDAGCAALVRYAEAARVPVCAAFRRQDLYDNDSPCYAGYLGLHAHASLWERVRESDCLLVLGARLDQATSRNFTAFDPHWSARHLIRVYPGARLPGRASPAALVVRADPAAFVAAMGRRMPAASAARAAWCARLRAEYLDSLRPGRDSDGFELGEVMTALAADLADDAIITLDAGNFTAWPQRYRRYRRPGRLLAPVNGAMGYGVPAAVAAALRHPRRTVVGFVGDGGMLMTGVELATAMHCGAQPIILIANNGMYGTIRLHQERAYPGRVVATDLTNPDFAAWARAFGAYGETVTAAAAFPAAFARAHSCGTAAVLDLRLDPRVLVPGVTLDRMARAARHE